MGLPLRKITVTFAYDKATKFKKLVARHEIVTKLRS
jgi:hypothetical protein